MTRPFPCTAIFFICVLLKTYRYFLPELHSSSAFALEKDMHSSTHGSCGPRSLISAQPEAVSSCPSNTDANTVGVSASSSAPVLPCWGGPKLWADSLGWPQHSSIPAEVPNAQGRGCPRGVLLPGWNSEALPCRLPRDPPCSCPQGSCWTSLAHRCHDSMAGSLPSSFSTIQYFVDLDPWSYSDISILAIAVGRNQAAQNSISVWNSLKMFKILMWDYFRQWGGCCKPQLVDCVTKPISFLCAFINCDNTMRNPES